MAKQPEHAHEPWTRVQKTELKKLARENTPTRIIALKLERTPSAVQTEASKLDVSLKPSNQSPYNRKSGK
jgi:hypothetical protein